MGTLLALLTWWVSLYFVSNHARLCGVRIFYIYRDFECAHCGGLLCEVPVTIIIIKISICYPFCGTARRRGDIGVWWALCVYLWWINIFKKIYNRNSNVFNQSEIQKISSILKLNYISIYINRKYESKTRCWAKYPWFDEAAQWWILADAEDCQLRVYAN